MLNDNFYIAPDQIKRIKRQNIVYEILAGGVFILDIFLWWLLISQAAIVVKYFYNH